MKYFVISRLSMSTDIIYDTDTEIETNRSREIFFSRICEIESTR